MRPERMSKVRIVAPKARIRQLIDTLYDLELMDMREFEDDRVERGSSLEGSDELSRLLVDIRSLISQLPEPDSSEAESRTISEVLEIVPELRESVNEALEGKEEAEEHLEELEKEKAFYRGLEGCGLKAQDLEGTENLNVIVARFEEVPEEAEVFEGKGLSVAVYADEETGKRLESSAEALEDKPGQIRDGQFREVVEEIEAEEAELGSKIEGVEDELLGLASDWLDGLKDARALLDERVEKSEASLNFGITERAFLAEGWVPSEEVEKTRVELEERLEKEVHLEVVDEPEDEPPVKHDNPGPVKPFESVNDLISVPRYSEVDPSILLLLTFPALFGFMIGDAGYGLTTFLVFLGGYRLFPEARNIFVSLMFASFFTFLFGLAFGDAFGYVIFGHHSALSAVTGMEVFSKIPILFHRAEHLGQVFTVAAGFGVFHVNLGLLVGAYNEYIGHGLAEAVLAKGSWILLQLGAGIAALVSVPAGVLVSIISAVMLYFGEGVEGLVEIPSLLSNILSYLRVFGVSVAAVVLAKVVNGMAAPLLGSGSLVLTVAGLLVLVIGHVFNTFIKIMEGFLQGIRLHYVEFYGQFYEGGGEKYVPFGPEEVSG